MPSEHKTNWFVRALVTVFCLLLAAMVSYKFIATEPKGEINSGVIALLSLILVLVLAESFDNFSVGKIISISRDVKKKEKEVEKLEKQNTQLLSQLITISNAQSQSQSHTNVYGDYHIAPTVQKASEEEVRDKESNDSPVAQASATEPIRTRYNWKKIEEIGLNKYLQSRSLHHSNVIADAKLTNEFHGIDPVSNSLVIFDGYIKEPNHETFIEIRPNHLINPMIKDRLYVMLSKINHYRIAKRVDAHLNLVLLKIPNEEPRFYTAERLLENFEPAIAGGLLRVVILELSQDEVDSCKEIR